MPGVDGHLTHGSTNSPLRMLLFHYAGGSAASMLPVARGAVPGAGSVMLQLNQRGHGSFTEAVEQLTPLFMDWVDRPTLVLGHSMGALLAHALVTRLPADRARHVRDVILSASRSPTTTARLATHPPGPFKHRSEQELIAQLRSYRGCPPELFDDGDLLDAAINMLGRDLHLIDTYQDPGRPSGHGETYHVWLGRDDEGLTPHESVLWSASVPTPPRVRVFEGGHFFLLRDRAAVLAVRELVDKRLNEIGR